MTDFPLTSDQLKSMYNRRLVALFFVTLFFSWNWWVAENQVQNLLFIGHQCVTESRVDLNNLNVRLDSYLGLLTP